MSHFYLYMHRCLSTLEREAYVGLDIYMGPALF